MIVSLVISIEVSVYLSSHSAHYVLDSSFTKTAIAVRQTLHRKVGRLVCYLYNYPIEIFLTLSTLKERQPFASISQTDTAFDSDS